MKMTLAHIIDLNYLLDRDEEERPDARIASGIKRDREIYRQIDPQPEDETALFMGWLKIRKKQVMDSEKKTGPCLLPGTVFSYIYTSMAYIMPVSGGMAGMALVWSFLAYHGDRPVNVALFLGVFAGLQSLLALVTLVFLARRFYLRSVRTIRDAGGGLFQTLISGVVFSSLPRRLRKTDREIFKKSADALEYLSAVFRIENRGCRELVFWPMFFLTSLFSAGFSAGALCGTFFRVLVSDLAFGWQSTLITSGESVYHLVRLVAMPWSWLFSGTAAHPGLDQIDGSRIILKDGIAVLATQDLISWWPFICLSILVYAVLPRLGLTLAGFLAGKRTIRAYRFDRPVFRQLAARMTGPVVDIESEPFPAGRAGREKPPLNSVPVMNDSRGGRRDHTVNLFVSLFVNLDIYNEERVEQIRSNAGQQFGVRVKQVQHIEYGSETELQAIRELDLGQVQGVLLVHEAWQPPIRGVQYGISRIRSILPENLFLWIYLTGDPGRDDMAVADTDTDFVIWVKTVEKLNLPGVRVKRYVHI